MRSNISTSTNEKTIEVSRTEAESLLARLVDPVLQR